MPWKQAYTFTDEKSLIDDDVVWPDGNHCAATIIVDLSLATTSEGVVARDMRSDRAMFGLNEGLDLVAGALDRFGLKATIPVPGIMAIGPPGDRDPPGAI